MSITKIKIYHKLCIYHLLLRNMQFSLKDQSMVVVIILLIIMLFNII